MSTSGVWWSYYVLAGSNVEAQSEARMFKYPFQLVISCDQDKKTFRLRTMQLTVEYLPVLRFPHLYFQRIWTCTRDEEDPSKPALHKHICFLGLSGCVIFMSPLTVHQHGPGGAKTKHLSPLYAIVPSRLFRLVFLVRAHAVQSPSLGMIIVRSGPKEGGYDGAVLLLDLKGETHSRMERCLYYRRGKVAVRHA